MQSGIRCVCCHLTAEDAINKTKEPLIHDYGTKFFFCNTCWDICTERLTRAGKYSWSNWLRIIADVREEVNPLEQWKH